MISRLRIDELVVMDFQCLYTILNALPVFGQYLTIFVGLDSLSVGAIMELLLLLLLFFLIFVLGRLLGRLSSWRIV